MREDLKGRLYNAAVRRARISSYNFTEIANADLVKFINEGVDKMSPGDYVSDLRRQVAEDNLIRLIDAMTNDGKVRRLTESLDFSAFNTARISVCPLWPFC
jgi:hypothetical protein